MSNDHGHNSGYQPPQDITNAVLIFPPIMGLIVISTVITMVILF